MSVRASAYVLDLQRCEDGAEMSAAQKMLLMVLADHHNDETKDSYPGLPLLASKSLQSEPTVKRFLKYLEQHCVLARVAMTSQGRGQFTRWVFLGLDYPEELAARLAQRAKGVQIDTLFSPVERGSEGVQKQSKRGSEGVQKGFKSPFAIRKNLEPRTKSNQEPTREGVVEIQTPEPEAARLWSAIASEMRGEVDRHRFDTWLKPVRAMRMEDGWLHLLVPGGAFLEMVTREYRARIQAACERLGLQGVILQSASTEAAG